MVLLMHDVFPVQYMFYQMGATDINKKLTSAMLLIIWMCVVTVLNGSKYVKKKTKKKLIYSFEIPEQNWEKYSFNEKKNQNFCIKK